jgi:phosphatidylserine decarboxylase
VITESLLGDRVLDLLYNNAREKAPALFNALTGQRASGLLAMWRFDNPLDKSNLWTRRLLQRINLEECLESPDKLDTPRKIFERKIRYWETRPMDPDPSRLVSPADSKVLVGSLRESSLLFLKGKFFDIDELLSIDRPQWRAAFVDGDYAIFRLTPDKYHYNHTPVSGHIVDIYQIPGLYHSCNPSAMVTCVTPLSKNKRVVTIIDTDCEGGSQVGLVAMIEIVALMIGDIVQRYSEKEYEDPKAVQPGLFVKKGFPKSLYRPGSSTDLTLFQRDRIKFSKDLVSNQRRSGIQSRFSKGFAAPLVETDLMVRSTIGTRVQ